MSIEIEWLGGNCPVQAEGAFDGEPFYFRARGSSVYVDVGEWSWDGPEYEWPDAGWISEDMARAFIAEAYRYWLGRKSDSAQIDAERKRRNGLSDERMMHIRWAARLDKVEGAAPVIAWHMERAKAIADGWEPVFAADQIRAMVEAVRPPRVRGAEVIHEVLDALRARLEGK